MAAVIKNIIEGASIREAQGVVIEITDIAVVTGLAGGIQWSSEALAAPGIPTSGESHPQFPTMLLRERRVIPLSPAVARIELAYRVDPTTSPTAVTIRGSTTATNKQTSVDRDDNQITTSRIFRTELNGVVIRQTVQTQSHTIPVRVAERSVSIADTRSSSDPDAFTSIYVNRINSVKWNNGDPGRWICTGIPYNVVDITSSPIKWRFTFEFQHREDGWQPEVVHTDSDTGRPVVPKVSEIVEWYDEIDFNNLELIPK